jgi:hypothetical protein
MSISLGSESVTLSKERRTWRVNLECALGTDYTITAFRELVQRVGDTVIAKNQNVGTISRALSAVIAEEVTLQSGKTLTPAEIAEGLAAFLEAWEVEDNAPAEEPDEGSGE